MHAILRHQVSKMSSSGGKAPRVGDRVQVAHHRATVKYVGEVEGQSGQWVGLDWDDASRGKNDGSTGGQAYFQSSAPTSGSFMRLEKFETQIKAGRSVLAAVEDRYNDLEVEADQGTRLDLSTKLAGKRGVQWQFIGAAKVHARLSQLQVLEKATLIDCCISCVVRLTKTCTYTYSLLST